MNRRNVLVSVVGAASFGAAGCLGSGAAETATETATETGGTTGTEMQDGGTVEYTINNEDDEAHPIEVTMENADGEVVHSKADSEFSPGDQLQATTSGHDPAKSPYPFTVALENLAETADLKLDECPRYDLLFTITSDGQLENDRTYCDKQ